MRKITIQSPDGYSVSATLYDGPLNNSPKGHIVYTHMMPATKESWQPLAEEFEKLGYVGLAIDLRGHGESSGGPDGYKDFEPSEHRAGKYDLDAATAFLAGHGANLGEISLIGASIGANLSLQRLSRNHQHKKAILLSPGLNYADIETIPLVESLHAGQAVFFASSRDDRVSGNAEQNEKLFAHTPEEVNKKILIYEHAGHGTDMLTTNESPNLTKSIIEFIQNEKD